MGKVYISQENANINYRPAQNYGETRFVTDLEFSLVDNSLKNEKIFERIREVIEAFDPLSDYIALTGSPITFGLLFHKIAAKCEEMDMPLKVLLWDRRKHEYQSITLSTENLK